MPLKSPEMNNAKLSESTFLIVFIWMVTCMLGGAQKPISIKCLLTISMDKQDTRIMEMITKDEFSSCLNKFSPSTHWNEWRPVRRIFKMRLNSHSLKGFLSHTSLHSIINSTKVKYCSIVFLWMITRDFIRRLRATYSRINIFEGTFYKLSFKRIWSHFRILSVD